MKNANGQTQKPIISEREVYFLYINLRFVR